MELNKIQSSGSWGKASDDLNQNFSKVNNAVEQIKNTTIRVKGYFSSESALTENVPTAALGDIAYVQNSNLLPFERWEWDGTQWIATGVAGGDQKVELGDYYTKDVTDAKFSELGSKVSKLEDSLSDIEDLVMPTFDTEYTLSDFVAGYYVICNQIGQTPSEPKNADGYYYLYMEVEEGDVFEFKLFGGSKGRAWAFIDSDGLVTDFCQEINVVESTITVPSGVTQVLFNSQSSSTYYVRKKGDKSQLDVRFENVESQIQSCVANITKIQGEVIELSESLSEIRDAVFPTVDIKYNLSDFVDGYYVICNQIGQKPSEPRTATKYAYMYQDTKAGDVWEVHLFGGANGRAWAFLDADGFVTEFCQDINVKLDTTVTVPNGVTRILFNTQYSSGYEDTHYVVKKGVESPENPESPNIQSNNILKILCFGNSFTQDSMSYVPYILKKIAPQINLTLGIAYIGGCPLVQHLASFTGESQTLNESQYEYSGYGYSKSINGEQWSSQIYNKSPDFILADEDWDIITFQQNGTDAAKDFNTYYAPYIYKLHKSLFDKIGKNVKLGWLLTQGAYRSTNQGCLENWQGTAENSKKVIDTTGTSVLFPFGTAVQNLRTTSLVSLGDGAGGLLMADGGHLQDGIGCLTAAYANALTILNCVGMNDIGVIGDTTRIDDDFITEFNIQGAHLGTSGVIGITEDNCYLAQVAAECAVKNPYEVTDLKAVEGGL